MNFLIIGMPPWPIHKSVTNVTLIFVKYLCSKSNLLYCNSSLRKSNSQFYSGIYSSSTFALHLVFYNISQWIQWKTVSRNVYLLNLCVFCCPTLYKNGNTFINLFVYFVPCLLQIYKNIFIGSFFFNIHPAKQISVL